MDRRLILIAHNVRSSHNVGSLLRTADGLGVEKVILSGYTPYPIAEHQPDERLPHIAQKVQAQIHKTALGAEESVNWRHIEAIEAYLQELRRKGYHIAALEQSPDATSLTQFSCPLKCAIIIGNEVSGLDSELLKLADTILEIPMLGQKESFNVVQAAAMALYQCRFAKSYL